MKTHSAILAHSGILLVCMGIIPAGIAQIRVDHASSRQHNKPRAANASSVFAAPQSYPAGFGDSAQAAVADFNGDGQLDMAVVNPCTDSNCGSGYASVAVLLNTGNGNFAAPVISATGTFLPGSLAAGDFNGDGIPDLAVVSQCASSATCGNGVVSVMLGNGDGTFQAPQSYATGTGASYFVAAGDFNGDGNLDLAVANQTSGNSNVSILLGNGDGTFQAPASYSTGATSAAYIALGDFNNDGWLDLAVVNGGTQDSVSILLGNGDGSFQTAVQVASGGAFAHSVAVADLNGDGAADLVVTNGCATYTNVLCSPGGSLGVLLGNGDGTFQPPVAYGSGAAEPNGIVVADFDGDGQLDVAVANLTATTPGNSAGVLSLLLGNGDGTFQPAVTFASGGNYALSVFSGDLNADGRPDLAVVNQCDLSQTCANGAVGLLLNTASNFTLYADSVSLTASPDPTAPNQAVILNAAVSANFNAGAVTGSVSFYDGATLLSSVPVSSGQAALTTPFATPGPHPITAVYSGDSNYAPGTSPVLSEIVGTPMTLTSSANPSASGQTVTFTATVSPVSGTPSGSVTFMDGSNSLGTVPLVNGSAAVSTSALTPGTHSITASYAGGGKCKPGSVALAQAVGQGTTIALASSANPGSANQTITFTATVTGQTGGTPSGVVAFMQGTPPTTWATATLIGGQASVTNAFNKTGTYPVATVYLGSPDYQTSTSTALNEVVSGSQGGKTSTLLASSANPSFINQPVTFTATVNPAVPDGETVTFSDGTNALGSTTTANSVAVFATSSLSQGNNSITATYAGDGTYQSSTSRPLNQMVNLNATTTVLSSSLNPSNYGQAVTLFVTVAPVSGSGTPTGKVTLYNGQNNLAVVTLTNGAGSYSTSMLPAGSLPLMASYQGDANFGTSNGNLTQQVGVANTTTSLSSIPNPSSINQSVTFTAMVTGQYGGSPSGAVTFSQGANTLGTASPVNGKATLKITFSTAGTFPVTASYPGDANDHPSSSNVVSQVVGAVSTTTAVLSSGSPSYIGQAVTLTATVTPTTGAIPNGETITFYDGSATIGTGSTSNGAAQLTFSTLPVGTHSITATYSGDAIYQTSTSRAVKQVVSLNVSNTAVNSSQNPSAYGQSVTFTATVTAVSGSQTPTGKITFKNGSAILGSVALANGVAAYTTLGLGAGSLSITAAYSGDGNFAASSASLNQTVNLGATQTQLSSNINPASINQSLTLSATVASPFSAPITGSVSFMQGSKNLGSGTYTKGKATLSLSFASAGTDSITAVYAGDANNQPSTSPILSQVITNSVTTTALATSGSPANVGKPVIFTATVTAVTGAIPDGESVTFYDGSNVIGTANTASGTAVLNTSTLASGKHSITASYPGDSSFEPSTSKVVNQVMQTNATNVVVTVSANPVAYGVPVTFTATVTSNGPTPTGTVTFKNGTATLGTAALSPQGVTTFTTVTLGAGSYPVTAAYNGDAASAKSTSTALNEVVNMSATTTQLISSVNPASPGESVTFTAMVRSATAVATGTVTFSAGSTLLGTASLVNGSAKLAVTTLPSGSSLVTATFAAGGSLAGSSASLTQSVN